MRDVMTRRAFLAAAGAAGALAHARPTSAADAVRTDDTAQAAPDKTDGTAPAAPRKIGQQPLKLGDDRDGLLYIPRGYKAEIGRASCRERV